MSAFYLENRALGAINETSREGVGSTFNGSKHSEPAREVNTMSVDRQYGESALEIKANNWKSIGDLAASLAEKWGK